MVLSEGVKYVCHLTEPADTSQQVDLQTTKCYN